MVCRRGSLFGTLVHVLVDILRRDLGGLRRDGRRRRPDAGRHGAAGQGIEHPHHGSQLRGRGERTGPFFHLPGGFRRHLPSVGIIASCDSVVPSLIDRLM